ncbi:hypothetical protein BAZSYMB_GORF82_GLIMMER3 [Bathymodiolus azoricus thioautotrophic gill symbiont]|uniref:Uncharacterized protein n=1 Tax=Bathymodiolus azoricus thioautotrophic gill symbiont TaxID=235205 RepID=A0A1H6KT48_9GAMM|nr:hypothetical protein BAZSYMB_GORF82_GLIMMER3 [Bathymodiolus azoricus thioautotrophic gill symbiont]
MGAFLPTESGSMPSEGRPPHAMIEPSLLMAAKAVLLA